MEDSTKVTFLGVTITLLLCGLAVSFITPFTPASANPSGVSPASAPNRFVVWLEEDTGNGDVFFRRSTDNGATWKAKVNLSNNPGSSNEPRIAVSGANVYVIWEQGSAQEPSSSISFRKSVDNAATWGSKFNMACSSCSIVDLMASGTHVYILLTIGSPADVFLWRSADNGTSWTQVNLSKNAGDSSDPVMAISSSNIYVAWTQASAGGDSYDIFFRQSSDNGISWKTRVNLSNDAEQSGNPDIAASDSKVHIVWESHPAIQEIYYRRSTDAGSTWKPVVQISKDSGSGDELNPQVEASGSKLNVVWTTRNGDVIFRRSIDDGVSWKNQLLMATNGSHSTEIQLAVFGSNVFLTMRLQDESPVLFSRSIDSGVSWSDESAILPPGRSYYHLLAVSGANLFIVSAERVDTSSDDAGEGQDVLVVRSTNSGSTWKSPINLSNTDQQSKVEDLAL